MPCLLMIDDDPVFCELLGEYLKNEGFEITTVHDGAGGLRRALDGVREYDLIVLDVMLPGKDGFDILQCIRARQETPVLMLTGSQEEMDRILGLEMGADDFLTKPFNPREFVARVRAILRRTKDPLMKVTIPPAAERIIVGDIELDTGARVARCNGEPLVLTSAEFSFLEILVRAAGHIVTREELAEKVLGRSLTAYDHSTYVHVSSLRKKLGDGVGGIERIKTVRGVGYFFANPSQPMESEIVHGGQDSGKQDSPGVFRGLLDTLNYEKGNPWAGFSAVETAG